MKKIQRILSVAVAIIGLGYNFSYADVIDPNTYRSSSLSTMEIIVIGIVIAAIVATAIMVVLKSKKNKDKKENNEK